MKIIPLTLTCLFAVSSLFAQKIELSVQANSSLFHYSGKSAVDATFINSGSNPYANNPYGTKNAAAYGIGLQAQYIARNSFIIGIQAGYDVLRSNVGVTGATPQYNSGLGDPGYTVYSNLLIPVKGQVYLTNHSLNFNPYLGYRINIKQVKLDLMPGLDIGANLSMYDKGTATATDGSNGSYNINYKREDAQTDVRFRFGAAAIFKKFGITASYAHGLTNYGRKMIGGDFEVHSELIRLGLSYRLF